MLNLGDQVICITSGYKTVPGGPVTYIGKVVDITPSLGYDNMPRVRVLWNITRPTYKNPVWYNQDSLVLYIPPTLNKVHYRLSFDLHKVP